MANHYDSDASTLVDEDRHRRQRRPQMRYRSPSADSRRTRQSYNERAGNTKSSTSKYETMGKVALVFGVIQLIGGIIHIMQKEKSKEKEREQRRQKRRAFERAKKKRRREDEKREREEDDGDSEDEEVRSREVRRITDAPARSHSTSSSHSRSERRIDPPPSRSERVSRGNTTGGSRHERDRRATSRMR